MSDDVVKAYQAMGFAMWDGVTPHVEYNTWQRLKDSTQLEDIRRRLLLQRDQPRCPIVVAEGFVVGFVPLQTLSEAEVEKLLSALTEGMARGLTTTAELARQRRDSKG